MIIFNTRFIKWTNLMFLYLHTFIHFLDNLTGAVLLYYQNQLLCMTFLSAYILDIFLLLD